LGQPLANDLVDSIHVLAHSQCLPIRNALRSGTQGW
jgi:hypothetical protein